MTGRKLTQAGVVKDDHGDGVAVAAEVLVIDFDGLSHVTQPVGGDDKDRLDIGHRWLLRVPGLCDRHAVLDIPARGRSRAPAAVINGQDGSLVHRIPGRRVRVEGE